VPNLVCISVKVITGSASQGYATASQFPEFANWQAPQAQIIAPAQQAVQQAQLLRPMSNVGGGVLARQMQPDGHAPQALAPSPAIAQPTPIAPQAAPQAASNTVFVVMAEIRSENGMAFLQTLQSSGTAQRIGDSVWLLRSGTSVEQLRNRLSQTLTRDDRLFILDSFQNETALTTRPGEPITSEPSGMSFPSAINVCAPIIQFLPIFVPFKIVEPIPISVLSPIEQPCSMTW